MALKLSRELTSKVLLLIDEWCPPFIRDSRIIMGFIFYVFFGKYGKDFLTFKEVAFSFSAKEYEDFYRYIDPAIIKRETHIHKKCVSEILENLVGSKVLDCGCGNGYLAKLMSKTKKVTAVDIQNVSSLSKRPLKIKFVQASVEKLPFKDKSFDTVICTHTLEHVIDVHATVKELRRVTKKRLIIVVPRQREYKYTFDLHLRFFPYRSSLYSTIGFYPGVSCELIEGDWLYIHDL